MKHYLKLSFLFFLLTIGITCWMSWELGLIGFNKLEAAEEVKPKTEPRQAKNETSQTKPTEAPKLAEEGSKKVETVTPAITPPQPPAKPVAKDLSELPLAEREKYVSEREEFLKKQSEYYERVIVELKEKLLNQGKESKQSASKQEGLFQQKMNEKDSEWKSKLEKADLEWKAKVAAKEVENEKLKKELATWKDARAELFRGMYEKMDSKRSAKILENLDVELSNKIIAGMKQDKAAEIMSKMLPEKAKLITEKTFAVRELSSQEKVNKSQGVEEKKTP